MPWDEPRGQTPYLPPPISGGGGSRSISDLTRGNTSSTTSTGKYNSVYRPPVVAAVTPPPATIGQFNNGSGGGSGGGSGEWTYGTYRGGTGGVEPPPATLFPGLDLPELYTTPFVSAFGPMPQYYTAARGGEDQAMRDYSNLVNFWASRTGRNPTPDEINRLMMTFPSWRNLAGRSPQFGDLMNYAGSVLRQGATPPQLSYLYMGEW